MKNKRSQAELVRLLESGIREVGDLSTDRFYIIVTNVEMFGSPPSDLRASVLIRFLPAGAPYCCGEPGCYSSVFRRDGLEELGDHLRRKMKLQQTVTVDLDVEVEYFDGVVFTDLTSG